MKSTRLSWQQGYVSDPMPSARGPKFVVKYRLRVANGKWQQKTKTVYCPNKKAAKVQLAEIIRETSNQPVEARERTFRTFVEGEWKLYLDRKQVKPSTSKSYRSCLETHILPVIGDMLLSDISPMNIENVLHRLAKAGRSARTLRNVVVLIGSIFSFAVENDLIARSPVRKSHKPSAKRNEKPSWTPDQVRRILETAPDEYRVFFITAAMTGARLGELLALQRKHVDLKARTLRIEQSLWHREIGSTKTGTVRTIAINDILADALATHLHPRIPGDGNRFVFAKPDGKPFNGDVLRKDVLYPILDRLQIPRTARNSGFHGFRHSAGSFVNSVTGNMKLAQKLLGHSNFNTTADVYTHTSLENEKAAAMAVQTAVFGPNLLQTVPKSWNNLQPN
jgi:integrase